MSDLSLQPRELWKQPGRLPAKGRRGRSDNTSNCLFLLPAWPSLHMCHLFGIRSLVSWSISWSWLCKEQQHSQKQDFSWLWWSWIPPGFQAGWSDYMFFSLFLLILFAHLELLAIFCTHEGILPYRSSAQMSIQRLPQERTNLMLTAVFSWGGRCLFCCTRHFRSANSTPLISISRNLAPFDKLGWKVITLKGFFSRYELGRTSWGDKWEKAVNLPKLADSA
jgi:hypothetical protein